MPVINPIGGTNSLEKKKGQGMLPNELLDEISKTILKDRGSLGSTNYVSYPGKTSAPMSTATQRARQLREEGRAAPAPYSSQIQTVLGRKGQGIKSPVVMNRHLHGLEGDYENFTRGAMTPLLQRYPEFQTQFQPEFERRRAQSRTLGLGEYEEQLAPIGEAAASLEQTRNEQLLKSLQGLRGQKEGRRESIAKGLDKFGAEEHAQDNLSSARSKKHFELERDAPMKRLEMLERAAAPLKASMADDVHPDIRQLRGEEALRALNTYKAGTPSYKGQLTAPLTPEMIAASKTLERLSPDYEDKYSGERDRLMQGLVGDQDVSARVLDTLPTKVRSRKAAIERNASERLRDDLNSLNNEYVRMGGFGSEGNVRSASKRADEINQAAQEQIQKLLQESLKSDLSTEYGKAAGDIGKLDMYGAEGEKEFSDVLAQISQMNTMGKEKWNNDQRETEDLFRNYQNEALWQYPHMRQAARSDAEMDIFGNVSGKTLDQLVQEGKTQFNELAKLRQQMEEVTKGKQTEKITNWQQQATGLQQELARAQAAQSRAQATAYAQSQAQAADDTAFAPFKGMSIYDTPRMLADLEQYRVKGQDPHWHPAAYFLRNNPGYLTLPNGKVSDRFGMSSPVTVDAYFKDKTNYPSWVPFPYAPPTTGINELRKYHNV